MKAYLSFLKLRINMGLQYRTAAIAGLLTQVFWGFMQIMIYKAYFRMGVDVGMTFPQLVSYIWLQQSFFAIIRILINDSDIHDSIKNGNISYELTRPISLYWLWYNKMLATRISSVVMRFWPILILAMILPSEYAIGAPVSILAFLLFVATLLLGVFITIATMMLVYVLMFYTTSSKGLLTTYSVIGDFFAGSLIPIPLMPSILQGVAYMLPFRFVCDLPLRLYIGNIGIIEGLQGMGIEIIWIVILITLGNILIKSSVKKAVVQGG